MAGREDNVQELLVESGIAGEDSRHRIAKALYILDRRVNFLL